MATYLFSENRELKNIQDGDVVVNDCESKLTFYFLIKSIASINGFNTKFKYAPTTCGVEICAAHFTRIHTEPQPAPMGSN